MPVMVVTDSTVPSTGSGACSSTDCSPWTSMAGLKVPIWAKAPPPPGTTTGKCRQHPLGHVLAVLGGELQFEPGGIDDAGADAQGVEQAVLGVPRRLAGFAGVPDGIRVDRHAAGLYAGVAVACTSSPRLPSGGGARL